MTTDNITGYHIVNPGINEGVETWVHFEKCGHVVFIDDFRQRMPHTKGPAAGRRCPDCGVKSPATQTTNPTGICTRCRKAKLSRYNSTKVCASCAGR